MTCKNPTLCEKKYKRWKNNQMVFVPIGEQEHELFLKYVKQGSADIGIHPHADKRQFERTVSNSDMKDVILHGWVMERNIDFESQAVRLVILGYSKTYRPIHVVTEILNEREWEIITVYSPESKGYKWSKDFDERICFCK